MNEDTASTVLGVVFASLLVVCLAAILIAGTFWVVARINRSRKRIGK